VVEALHQGHTIICSHPTLPSARFPSASELNRSKLRVLVCLVVRLALLQVKPLLQVTRQEEEMGLKDEELKSAKDTAIRFESELKEITLKHTSVRGHRHVQLSQIHTRHTNRQLQHRQPQQHNGTNNHTRVQSSVLLFRIKINSLPIVARLAS